MAKKLVKLTESDLHRIIKESVNKVLTELDWKTYQSAAEKEERKLTSEDPASAKQMNRAIDRINRFCKASEKSFDDQKDPNSFGILMHDMDEYGNSYPNARFYAHDSDFDGYEFRMNDPKNSYIPKRKGLVSDLPYDERDVRQVANGTAKYIKGKGWTKPRQLPKGFKK